MFIINQNRISQQSYNALFTSSIDLSQNGQIQYSSFNSLWISKLQFTLYIIILDNIFKLIFGSVFKRSLLYLKLNLRPFKRPKIRLKKWILHLELRCVKTIEFGVPGQKLMKKKLVPPTPILLVFILQLHFLIYSWLFWFH